MQETNNSVGPSPTSGVVWRKSRHSNPYGNCVELAELADGRIAVRNSRYPGGLALIYPRAEMAVFIHGAKQDEFVPRPD